MWCCDDLMLLGSKSIGLDLLRWVPFSQMTATFQICRNQSIAKCTEDWSKAIERGEAGCLSIDAWRLWEEVAGTSAAGSRSMTERTETETAGHLMNYVAGMSGRLVHVDLNRGRGVQLLKPQECAGFSRLISAEGFNVCRMGRWTKCDTFLVHIFIILKKMLMNVWKIHVWLTKPLHIVHFSRRQCERGYVGLCEKSHLWSLSPSLPSAVSIYSHDSRDCTVHTSGYMQRIWDIFHRKPKIVGSIF